MDNFLSERFLIADVLSLLSFATFAIISNQGKVWKRHVVGRQRQKEAWKIKETIHDWYECVSSIIYISIFLILKFVADAKC